MLFGITVSGTPIETIFQPIRKSGCEIWTSASNAASDLLSAV